MREGGTEGGKAGGREGDGNTEQHKFLTIWNSANSNLSSLILLSNSLTRLRISYPGSLMPHVPRTSPSSLTSMNPFPSLSTCGAKWSI